MILQIYVNVRYLYLQYELYFNFQCKRYGDYPNFFREFIRREICILYSTHCELIIVNVMERRRLYDLALQVYRV